MKSQKPNCFSSKIDVSLAKKLKEDLAEQGFSFTKPPHTIFSAKKEGIVCNLYESGALTVQGKEKDPFIEFYLEPTILKTFTYSYPEANVDHGERIGVDEAGKGDFFGPLCIAGVFADAKNIDALIKLGVRDSKTLSDTTILKLAKEIKSLCPHVVIRLFPEKYNELYLKFKNLNSLLGWAHATAIADLCKKTSCKRAIIDQFASKSVVERAISQKKIELFLEQRHRGEEDVVVAAASILARAAFVEGIDLLGNEISFKLPKGASSLVKEAGKKIVSKFGPEMLEKVAKIHFKTRNEILQAND